MDNICNILKQNSAIILDWNYKKLNNEDIVKIAKKLSTLRFDGVTPSKSSNSTLHTLDLSGNNIGQEGAVEIAKILEENYVLTNLNLGIFSNKIDEILERNKKIAENKRFMRTKCAYI